jgi:hypothetical protein
MRLKPQQAEFMARKIAIDLANTPFVKLLVDKERVAQAAWSLIDNSLRQEQKLDERVKDILEENNDEIEFQHADERQLFFMIKKKLAPEYGVIMNYEDRYEALSHEILYELYDEYLIDYNVSDNRVKNVIFRAFGDFIKTFDEVDDFIYKKIRNMKKEYIPGSEEYELIYNKLYEEELRKRGMI